MNLDEASVLLRIASKELNEYERGMVKIPADILERMFLLAYKTMRMRTLENVYRCKRNLFRRLSAQEKNN